MSGMVFLHLSWLIKASSPFAILVSLTQAWADILKTRTEINPHLKKTSYQSHQLTLSPSILKESILKSPSERQTVPMRPTPPTHRPSCSTLTSARAWFASCGVLDTKSVRISMPLCIGIQYASKREFQEFWAIMYPGIFEFSSVFILWYMYAWTIHAQVLNVMRRHW